MLIVYCWDMLLNVVYGVFLYVDVLYYVMYLWFNVDFICIDENVRV